MDKLMGSLVRLAAAFPLAHVPESTITLYHSKLSHCETDTIVKVIERSIESAKTFPTISELRHDYNGEISRRSPDLPALVSGGVPMPAHVKAELENLYQKMAGRAAELEV